MPKGSSTPWSYFLIRVLFKFVLKIFYGTIVVEGTENIPPRGVPCIVCSNHSNSLTDALVLVATIPFKRRNLLRLTAKSTQFGKKTFTSWLIESAGTLPIQRRKDFADGQIDNNIVMQHLLNALDYGDAVCLFPEGASRFHPTIAPLKTGVARMASSALSRNRNSPDFEICILTCSITYMHRQHFRSDVLVTYHPPIRLTPSNNPELLEPVDYSEIRSLTARMHQQIGSGTLDAPSWRLHRVAKLAARIYAPLGTEMSLGDYVRVVRTFLEAFKLAELHRNGELLSGSDNEPDSSNDDSVVTRVLKLEEDLKVYQDELATWGLKDDRIRKPLKRRVILYRILVRLTWSVILLSISLPGVLLWTPIAIATFIAVREFKRSGPIWDTWDEIAQYKLVYGLISGIFVWTTSVLLTFPVAFITVWAVPVVMWLSLRWFEDAVSAFRAFVSLARLLRMGRKHLGELRTTRDDLHRRVMDFAVNTLGLPGTPEQHFTEGSAGQQDKGRIRGPWASKAKYFSLRRRRKRDWNETLRLYDQVDDYPEDF
ncbi:hypothetical protein BDY19DRAFT_205795 [Irpex rosettiformis]|uniref:Uncharacterized protein n=1 Tax=Irpex rosettiformis TaxID=378272 RepID=A0ACB8U164_9APHY|nr:hypothetical protein BDY19DRAFT_205795 [Irpex rosettiformis]